MREKCLFFFKESVVNGKSYYQLWYRGQPDKFICTEKKLVKLLFPNALFLEQTKENLENLTKIQEGEQKEND
jgi:hypothetical protein